MTTATEQLPIVNISSYKFIKLDRLEELRNGLKSKCKELALKGTILLSSEGINMFLAGNRQGIDGIMDHIRSCRPEFSDIQAKESLSKSQPFSRMLVRLKKEIIAFGINEIEPEKKTSSRLKAQQLKQWLDEGKDLTLLDTRNDYEVEIGTFQNALPVGVDHFRDFPEAVEKLDQVDKDKPLVMFCTGGVRCEKAGPFMENAGFKEIYQLDGGILKYFEEVGGDHWDGECFVFDKRVALDPELKETATTQCYSCQHPLTPKDQASEDYCPPKHCPFCKKILDQRLEKSKQDAQQNLLQFSAKLPGSTPYTNQRPLNVPRRYEGQNVLDFVDGFHPQMGRDFWGQVIAKDRLTLGVKILKAEDRVTEGMQIVHHVPETVEPDVNADIQILHLDDSIVVVSKPAPLPVHPSGRFNKNTLGWMLGQALAPQKLRPAHRLDSNTSGVVVFARTRKNATKLRQCFEQKGVQKTYLALVTGSPKKDKWTFDAAISDEPGEGGIRSLDPVNGLAATTEFEVIRRNSDGTSLLKVTPVTGRTHQIRVHLWAQGHSIIGDPAYLPNRMTARNQSLEVGQPPMCLHAHKISFVHPVSGQEVEFCSEIPNWGTKES